MIVTFKTNPQGSNGDFTAGYINFLRCVTAIMTAPAGTTSLTVNPYTSSNTINTSFNCIVSIDANTEAGGWTTSSAHNVPSSDTNTPIAYTSLQTAGNFLYKADFYKSSGKTNAACQYLKMSFHTYNDYASSDSHFNYNWGYTRLQRGNITANSGSNMLITYGHSSSTNWTDTGFPPGGGSASQRFNNTTQVKSKTMNSDVAISYYNAGPALAYTDSGVQYKMAVAADYCIIWEDNMSSYATGNFQSATYGGPYASTYFNTGRHGGIFYMGMRDTQPWENTRDDNPAWVAWNALITRVASGGSTQPWTNDGLTAWMSVLDYAGNPAQPTKQYTNNRWNAAYFSGGLPDKLVNNAAGGNYEGYGDNYGTNAQGLDVMMRTKNWGGGTTYNALNSRPSDQSLGYLPQIDSITGTWVPGAYPLVVSRSMPGSYNAGGKCRGIYKSLSMSYSDMKRFWQSANQTFTVAGETYMPIVILEDMWLIRVA